MNKVWFSNVEDSWDSPESGKLKVIIIPKKWWSLRSWKIAFEFSRDFVCRFEESER